MFDGLYKLFMVIIWRWVISGPASQEDVPLRYNLVDVKKSEVDEEMTL